MEGRGSNPSGRSSARRIRKNFSAGCHLDLRAAAAAAAPLVVAMQMQAILAGRTWAKRRMHQGSSSMSRSTVWMILT